MKKLTIEHLAPYMPYGVQMKYIGHDRVWLKNGDITTLMPSDIDRLTKDFELKLFLRPLSDLTKEINHNGEKFIPMAELLKMIHPNEDYESKYGLIEVRKSGNVYESYYKYAATYNIVFNTTYIDQLPYWIIRKLFEWHFDVFGLIEQDLAIAKS